MFSFFFIFSDVVATCPDFSAIVMALLGGVIQLPSRSPFVQNIKAVLPNQWRRKRRNNSNFHKSAPLLGNDEVVSNLHKSMESTPNEAASVRLPLKYIRRAPGRRRKIQKSTASITQSGPTDTHQHIHNKASINGPWQWILSLVAPVSTPPVIYNGSSSSSTSSYNSLDGNACSSLLPSPLDNSDAKTADQHRTVAPRWRRRISSRLSSPSEEKLRFPKRSIRRHGITTTVYKSTSITSTQPLVCAQPPLTPEPMISIPHNTFPSSVSTAKQIYLQSLKLNYSNFTKIKQRQWTEQKQKNTLKTSLSQSAPENGSVIVHDTQVSNIGRDTLSNAIVSIDDIIEVSVDENKTATTQTPNFIDVVSTPDLLK